MGAFSPERLANDPQALARFEREAKAVAALSHPNILGIHDFGSEAGIAYAVTELLEGETLRRSLSRAAMPWRKAVETGIAIADGLAAAHSRAALPGPAAAHGAWLMIGNTISHYRVVEKPR